MSPSPSAMLFVAPTPLTAAWSRPSPTVGNNNNNRSLFSTTTPRRPHLRPQCAPPRMGTAMPEIPEVQLPAPVTPATPMDPALSDATAVDAAAPIPTAAKAEPDEWLASFISARAAMLHPLHPLAPLRAAADPLLADLVRPHRRVETWRFTDLRPLYTQRYQPSASPTPAATATTASQSEDDVRAAVQKHVPADAAVAIVFVDGVFAPQFSRLADEDGKAQQWLDAGGFFGSIADYSGDRDRLFRIWGEAELGPSELGGFFPTVGNAFASDAIVLHAPAGYVVDGTVAAVFLSTSGSGAESATATAPRLAIVAGRDSKLSLIEKHASITPAAAASSTAISDADSPSPSSSSLALASTAVAIEENATVTHWLVNDCAADAVLLHSLYAKLPAHATYECRPFAIGGSLSRFSVGVDITGEGAHGLVHGALVSDGRQIHDIHSRICHDCLHATSSQLQKNVVAGRARAIFNGKIIVTPNGDGTRSEQLSRSLLLSEKAQVDAMPVLEIATDDVECTHGVTISDLEDDEVFYFQSRGISHSAAQAMLLQGFVKEALGSSPPQSVLGSLQTKMDRLSAATMARQKEVTEYTSV